MTEEVSRLLRLDKRSAVMVDATFGYGGHSRLLVEGNDLSFLLAIDRDPRAVEAARAWAAAREEESGTKTKIEVVHDTFDK
ncbi:MAG: 16S rRNA (cytosine(1402)-N(4))-methyltransferase, partial [Planctomycetes bacterium]|nr:16S rRNA (cytosine(1402)-N(4))-methyltransferase [Planctomycetota bacterium]